MSYYGYRGGMWRLAHVLQRCDDHYKVGTGNIDVVDAARKQLVWEGVAEARITDKMLDNGSGNRRHRDRDVPQFRHARQGGFAPAK
jgi:hypothetical protein